MEIIQTAEFQRWLKKLRDKAAGAIIRARLNRMEEGNLGDVRPVGDGVSETRIHYGPGYRLYFIRKGNVTIVMLGGGDKSSQTRDIAAAKKLAARL